MKCHTCKGKAAVEIRRHRLAFCGPHYLEWFEGQVQKAIDRHRMFSRDDRVLVTVSGGKDSLALWEALTRLGYAPTGFHLQLGIGDYSRASQEKTEAFARERGLPLITADLFQEHGLGVPELAQLLRRAPCSGCGLSKRYLMNRMAAEQGFDVVATGHNLDDEAATLFGNVLNWQTDALARQSPVLESTHPRLVKRVKPLYLMSEKDTASYALLRRIDYIVEECPNAHGARSIAYKEALNHVERQSPGAKHQFLTGYLKKMQPVLRAEENTELRECTVCGYMTTTEVCAYCRMWDRAREKARASRSRASAQQNEPLSAPSLSSDTGPQRHSV